MLWRKGIPRCQYTQLTRNTWMTFDDITRAFCALAATPDSIDDWMEPLERFVVLLYDRTRSQESVNQARKQLFTQESRTIDGLPPTQAALIRHMKRAAYQAGHCWGQMTFAASELPSPGDWGGRERTQVMESSLNHTTRSNPGLSCTPLPWMQKGMQWTV